MLLAFHVTEDDALNRAIPITYSSTLIVDNRWNRVVNGD